jgi:hypothetical protein
VPRGLRLIVYDKSCVGRFGFGLSRVWSAGRYLYAALGRSDGAHGASSFEDAFGWLAEHRSDEPIAEVQFWAHGKWGRLFLEKDILDRGAFSPGHRLHGGLSALRERLLPDSLIWFRSCETFGASAGHDFARRLTDFLACPAAGHTFIIGYWQSGLHQLEPGQTPRWPATEGLAEGSPDRPERAAWSSPGAPNTITCFTGRVPASYASSGAGGTISS